MAHATSGPALTSLRRTYISTRSSRNELLVLLWRKSMKLYRAFAVCFAILAFALVVPAADNGDINGVVRDPSGAVLPGVSITVTNEATGAARNVVSNETGQYTATL